MSDNEKYIWWGLAIAGAIAAMAAIWYYGGFDGTSKKAEVDRIAPEIPRTTATATTS